MFVYSSVSPYYLDYLASARTRQEILDDPNLCHFLEDPLIKDNMEMALRWKEAKRGGYAQKKAFIEYFFCNGPELDSDTILYYREKCMIEPVYLQIASIEFSDFNIVDELRVSKYGKTIDDCFTQPCNYLGPLSSSIGMMGDSNNFLTLSNLFAKKQKKKEDDKKKEEENKNKNTTTSSTLNDEKEEEDESVWGRIRQHVTPKILPNIRLACQALYNNMQASMQEFLDRAEGAGILDKINLGDPFAIDRAELLSAATKANTFSRMGDCGRLWQYMRQYNPYDPNRNTKGPISEAQLVDNKSTNGTSIDNTPVSSPIKNVPSSVLSGAAGCENSSYAQAVKRLTELSETYTLKDIDILKNGDEAEKRQLVESKTNNNGEPKTNYQENDNPDNNWARFENSAQNEYNKQSEANAEIDKLTKDLINDIRIIGQPNEGITLGDKEESSSEETREITNQN